jgi:hypothetical protein
MKNVGTSVKVFLATKKKFAVVSKLISLAFVSKGTEHKSLGLIEVRSGKPSGCLCSAEADALTPDVYEIRPRKDGDGFDLISDRLGSAPIWYAGPDAVRNAVAYAKYRSSSCSCRTIIRVLESNSNALIEAH